MGGKTREGVPIRFGWSFVEADEIGHNAIPVRHVNILDLEL